MKILVIGSGGREHALVWKIAQSPKVDALYCAPGNGGIGQQAKLIDIRAESLFALSDFAKKEHIDLTVVGPEVPLVDGVVDVFEREGLRIFGPRRDLALLEGSKVYAKELMAKFGIPTADFKVFDSSAAAKAYVDKKDGPCVVKADGLCGGKGVAVCQTKEETKKVISSIMDDKIFGDAGSKVVIEECLEGEEASIIVIVDGKNYVKLVSSQDHKRAYDGDRGPNTGGMGAFSPASVVTADLYKRIENEIVGPLLAGLSKEGKSYKGALYVGAMMTKTGPKVLEFNVRFGDPETQAILPRLKTDLVEVMERAVSGQLGGFALEWDPRPCVSVVIASVGYPGYFKRGKEISGLSDLEGMKDIVVFHSGTKQGQRKTDPTNSYITIGGRVLAVTALGMNIKEAADACYKAVAKVRFDGMHYRKDIGFRELNRESHFQKEAR